MNFKYKGTLPNFINLIDSFHVTETYQHNGWIEYVSFSQDSSLMVSASWDKTIKVWKAISGEIIITLRGHKKKVIFADFLSGNSTVISGSSDGTIKIWDITTGNILSDIKVETSKQIYYALSQDKKLIACADNAGHINIWNTESGDLIKSIISNLPLMCIKFAPNNLEILGSTRGFVMIWNIESGQMINKLNLIEGDINYFSLSPDSEKIAIGAFNQVLIVDVNAGTKKIIKTTKQDAPQFVLSSTTIRRPAEFTPDGSCIIIGDGEKAIKLIEIDSEKIIYKSEEFQNGFNNIAISNDGTLFTGSNNSTKLYIWNIQKQDIQYRSGGNYEYLFDCKYSPDGNYIGCGLGSGTIIVFDPNTGNSIMETEQQEHNILGITFSPDGNKIAGGGGDKIIKIWDIKTGANLSTLKGHNDFIKAITFDKNEQFLYSVGSDKKFIIWDILKGKKLKNFKKHAFPVNALAISQDNSMVATGSNDGSINLWDVKTYKLIKKLIPPIPPGESKLAFVYSLIFSKDSSKLIGGLSEGYLIQYDLRANYDQKMIKAHDSHIDAIAINSDGTNLITGSRDSTIKIWDAMNLQQIYQSPILGGEIWSVSVHPNGDRYLVGLDIGDIFTFKI